MDNDENDTVLLLLVVDSDGVDKFLFRDPRLSITVYLDIAHLCCRTFPYNRNPPIAGVPPVCSLYGYYQIFEENLKTISVKFLPILQKI